MRKTALALALIAGLPAHAHAQEFTTFYGKGVSNNPNADLSVYSLSWKSGRVAGVPLRTHVMTGEAYGDAKPRLHATGEHAGGGGARPFKFAGIGKEIELSKGAFFVNLGAGVAVLSRTSDAAEYAATTYTTLTAGIRYKAFAVSFGRWHAQAPKLHDPWSGQQYDAPTFQGVRMSVHFNLAE